MRFGSVCSGIEAASVASEPLGWEAAWFSEIEPFPCAVLQHHHPEVPNHGDMTLLPDSIRSGVVEAPDVLVGGTPCQAFSVAGHRKGLDDARGNLTLIFCDIADAIDERRMCNGDQPCIVLWENVPGVLSDKTNAFGCFLGELVGESDQLIPPGGKWANAGVVAGPQRTAAWRILDAQYFGVAQRRRRVFVVASAREDFDPVSVLLEFGGVRRDSAPSRESGKETASDVGAGIAGATTYGTPGNWIGRKPENGGNAVEPMVDIAPCLTSTDRHGAAIYENHPSDSRVTGPYDFSHTLTSKMGTGGGNVPLVGPAYAKESDVCDTVCSKWVKGSGGPAGSETGNMVMQPVVVGTDCYNGSITGDIACTMGTPGSSVNASGPTVMQPVQCLMDQGGSVMNIEHDMTGTLRRETHGHEPIVFHPTQDPISSTNVCHSLGANSNATAGVATQMQAIAFNGDQSAKTRSMGESVEQCPTLRAISTGIHCATQMQVRRLTPTECEKLMGFPPGYTQIPWRGKPADQCPDGPRYKALGNSWAVPCVRWIFERIDKEVKDVW